jgi:hypothetical protein
MSQFGEVKLDRDRILNAVTLKWVSRAARRRLAQRFPEAQGLDSDDPAIAEAAAKRVARRYLRMPDETTAADVPGER